MTNKTALEEWFEKLLELKDPIQRVGRATKVMRMARQEPGHDFVSLKLNSELTYGEQKYLEEIFSLLKEGDVLPNGLKLVKE